MKKAKFCTLAVLLILLSLVTGCQQETARYVVSFVDEGTSDKEVIVNDGEVIKQSDIPELNEKEGLSFQGWYLGDKKFEFTTTIRSNIVLETRWIHDKHVFGEDGVCTICNGTKCGADAVASFDEESKVLTITGRGSLDNYELDPENEKDNYKYIIDPPWYSRINEIKSIVIGEGITSVGDFSFCDIAAANEGNLTVLESVTLPSTLESIGVFAFFATGISEMCATIPFLKGAQNVIFSLLVLAVSAFCLTSLDTATRLARYMFQEFWLEPGQTAKDINSGWKKVMVNPVFATVLTVVLGIALGLTGWQKIWGLFGASNQLLAGIGLLAVATWLGNIGKNNKMFLLPMAFMVVVTISSLAITLIGQVKIIAAGGADWGPYAQVILAAFMIVLSVILVIEGVTTLAKKKANA